MGALSRRKGMDFQRYVANKLKPLWPEAHSTGTSQARSRKATVRPPDVDGTPYWIEAKVGKTFKVLDAFKQALEEAAAANDKRPILVLSRAHGCPEALVWQPCCDDKLGLHVYALLLEDWIEANTPAVAVPGPAVVVAERIPGSNLRIERLFDG